MTDSEIRNTEAYQVMWDASILKKQNDVMHNHKNILSHRK